MTDHSIQFNYCTPANDLEEVRLHRRYIVNNYDKLEQWQTLELRDYIARYNTSCMRQNSDGIRINIDMLDGLLVRKIATYIRNAVEYLSFFL